MTTTHKATIEDLYSIRGKAEIVNGEIIEMPPTGHLPGYVASRILYSLITHEHMNGHAIGDNVGFIVDLPNRRSFSPDAAWHIGEPTGMKFLEGAPVFAAEVRSENDYGPKAERAMAEKRRDYFAAGTLCVWDVDMQSLDVIKSYHASAPDTPVIFRRNDVTDAGEAVPGWTFPDEWYARRLSGL